MTRRASKAPLLAIAVDKTAPEAAYRQVYDQIRTTILEGRIAPGTRLPATRALAAELGVSRNTVLTAYEMLLAEGYTEGRVGSGTEVSGVLPEALLAARGETRPVPRADAPDAAEVRLSALARRLPPARQRTRVDKRAFRPGLPEVEQFPWDVWGRLVGRFWRHPPRALLNGMELAGYRPLRDAIAAYLGAMRGVKCDGAQVVITSGAQEALDLVSRLLLDPGDAVWMEEPGYAGLRGAFTAAGARVVPVPVDAEGIDVARGQALAADAVLCAVTPSHQYPLGITMSLARRLELLDWARQAGAWILEDDYDSEYRYAGKPLSALQGLDAHGRVIYVGTFSKVMFQGIRLGYLVLPAPLVEPFLHIRSVLDDAPSLALQPALARFIDDGHFAAHVRRMRALYAERQALLIETIGRDAGGKLTAAADEAGMHLVVDIDPAAGLSDAEVSARAAAAGISAPALSAYYAGEAGRAALVLGYSGLNDAEIRDGVKALRGVFTRARPDGG
ncbi:MAG: PLP-dependent aminotransferase family protein [Magnetovibrio sp.]|nr:PLP-dependent aminotransferase family protein [Magnetovibrio sp.]